MATAPETQISRRGAVALAAALAATVATSIATYGGIVHWRSQIAAQPAPAAQVVQAPSAPAPSWTAAEASD